MRNHSDYEAEPFRVTWFKESGNLTRTYASESAARNAFTVPLSANVGGVALDRMEKTKKGSLQWRAVRMNSRTR